VLTLVGDTCLAELVDEHNRPVAPGTPSARVLVTNLYNRTQPLIRYELTDRFIGQPAAPDGNLRAVIDGRADDLFRYGTVVVHPHIIRSVLVQAPTVVEYQVRQTPGGVDVDVVVEGPIGEAELAGQLRHDLRRAGLDGARATVRVVDSIARHPGTGKLRRFIPLGSAAGAQGTKRTS
jgi:phenylacetate-coenzyme A ligase PaaK-like adenylate-forming protein